MTVVPQIPIQIIAPADVRASIGRARRSLERAAEEIIWQIEMEGWRTLGYPSWSAMREAEYGGAAFMVPAKNRPELVARIRAAGLTQQEIADTAGVSVGTVNGDLKLSSENEIASTASITNSRGQQRPATYARHDANFKEDIAKAGEEGDLSRADTVRDIQGESAPETRAERAELIEKLAARGMASAQMAPQVGVTERRVRQIARDFGIDIAADRLLHGTRRIDSNQVLSSVAFSLDASVFSLCQINPSSLDRDASQEWLNSLTESISALGKALNQIKESIRG